MLDDTFTLRVGPTERRQLEAIAKHLERSQSDAVRWLIRQAATKGLLPADQAQALDAAEADGATANGDRTGDARGAETSPALTTAEEASRDNPA
jgi:hypothetical protein